MKSPAISKETVDTLHKYSYSCQNIIIVCVLTPSHISHAYYTKAFSQSLSPFLNIMKPQSIEKLVYKELKCLSVSEQHCSHSLQQLAQFICLLNSTHKMGRLFANPEFYQISEMTEEITATQVTLWDVDQSLYMPSTATQLSTVHQVGIL